MYRANSTPSLYTHNAPAQCTVKRSALTSGLFAALLFLCSAAIVPASAQEPAHAIKAMVQTQLEYIFVQVTFFNNGRMDLYVEDALYSYEMCHARSAESTYDWKLRGDPSFVRVIKYICIRKGSKLVP